jgi:protein SCO1/2
MGRWVEAEMNPRKRMRWPLVLMLLVAGLLSGVLIGPPAGATNYRMGNLYGGDFTLTDHEGRQFSLHDARGKVVLIHFGYTSCADTCPTTMAKVAAVLDRLGPRAAQVQPLLISVDTRRDTPEVLRNYVANFHPTYLGLTGTQEQVEAVARQYRAPIHVHKPDQKGFYVADHGSVLYLVNTDGTLADLLFFNLPPEKIAIRIENLLKQEPDAHQHHRASTASTRGYERSVHFYRIPDVTLVDMAGAKVSVVSALQGDAPTFLNFIFTSCTSICPVMSATFAEVQRQLGPDRERVRMISISIDPEHDSPEKLRAFARTHEAGPQWRFLTGNRADIVAVQKAFNAYRGNKMGHEPFTFVRASAGDPWVRLDGLASAAELIAEYRRAVSK